MSVLLECPTCKKKFYANESAVRKGRKYCSKDCVPWSKIHKGRQCVSIIMEMNYRLRNGIKLKEGDGKNL